MGPSCHYTCRQLTAADISLLKDVLAVFEASGQIQSTTPDGKKEVGPNRFAQVLFAPRDRTHSEVLFSGQARAIIIELK